jgi:hypothetical protein
MQGPGEPPVVMICVATSKTEALEKFTVQYKDTRGFPPKITEKQINIVKPKAVA